MKPLITIITATTGKYKRAQWSVLTQTYTNIQHIIVSDGADVVADNTADFILLPYNTGADGYNGHKIYAAATFLAKGDYICYLDEDNILEPDHIQSLVDVLDTDTEWAYSLRNIISNGEFVCRDDCESLGTHTNIMGETFCDVNTWMIRADVARKLAPLWHRRARKDLPEVDRLITNTLLQHFPNVKSTGKYTLNYNTGNTANSVKPEFFVNGNRLAEDIWGGHYPWQMI